MRETQSPLSLTTANYDSWGEVGDRRRTTATNSEKVEFRVFSGANTSAQDRQFKKLSHVDFGLQ